LEQNFIAKTQLVQHLVNSDSVIQILTYGFIDERVNIWSLSQASLICDGYHENILIVVVVVVVVIVVVVVVIVVVVVGVDDAEKV
jgi:hypothetical protein